MKLRPCPFCGGESLHCRELRHRGLPVLTIWCGECLAMARHGTLVGVAEAWNRRSSSSDAARDIVPNGIDPPDLPPTYDERDHIINGLITSISQLSARVNILEKHNVG